MRILWFVNIPFPVVIKKIGLNLVCRGGWLTALAESISLHSHNVLGIVWASDDIDVLTKIERGDRIYYILPSRNAYRKSVPSAFESELKMSLEIINEFQPDIINVHGTENFYGLIANRTSVPVLITLQGIVNEIKNHYFGSMSLIDILKAPSIIKDYVRFLKRCSIEKEIFSRNKYFTGRTLCDESYVRSQRIDAEYYVLTELLRNEFDRKNWELKKVKRHTIYSTLTVRTYKGLDIIIQALGIVKNFFPDIVMRVSCELPDGGYGKYLSSLINTEKISNSIIFLGTLTAAEVVDELLKANVYVMPSFIENSPNNLLEALTVGVPCVASFTGGVQSMVHDEQNALLFPRGDFRVMALQIVRILMDDDLAIRLSEHAKKTSRLDHCPEKNVSKLIEIYNDVINKESQRHAHTCS